jgi:hypothetical protein
VSILKSLADWEQHRRDSSKQGSTVESHEEDGLRSLTTDETKSQDDGLNQFERVKAHKSTMEAAISEVWGLNFYYAGLQMGSHHFFLLNILLATELF